MTTNSSRRTKVLQTNIVVNASRRICGLGRALFEDVRFEV